MRLQKYLNEKYFSTVKQKYDYVDYEVFENPSRKELQEIMHISGGMRFIIDFKSKKFYAFSDSMFHETFFKNSPALGKTWNEYWTNGKGIDYIYTGAMIGGKYESDSIRRFTGTITERTKFKKDLQKLLDQDWSWVSRYIDVKKVRATFFEWAKDELVDRMSA